MPPSITIIVATLCAVASAIPHVHRHRHAHHHLLKDLAGRDLTDGVCGGPSAFTCAPGYCCSAWGYCGQTSDYCGTGCQSQWGQCGSKAATSPAETAPAGETPTLPSVATTFEPSTAYAPSTFATSTSAAPVSTSEAGTASSIDPSAYTASPSASGWDTTSTTSSAAASTSSTSTSSAAASTSSTSSSSSGLGDTYKMYTGDGSTPAGWPAQSSWASFDDLWTANTAVIAQSCTQFSAPNNSDDETSHLRSAISAVAASSGIDARFILAIVLQESGGCVRAPTSNYGVTNPGLMQSHDGTGSCNDGAGAVQDPCPPSEMTQMIADGTTGTRAGDGLAQTLRQAGCEDVSRFYKAARLYNSGSIAPSRDLGAGVATHCYASDVANRLTGWVYASHGCTLD